MVLAICLINSSFASPLMLAVFCWCKTWIPLCNWIIIIAFHIVKIMDCHAKNKPDNGDDTSFMLAGHPNNVVVIRQSPHRSILSFPAAIAVAAWLPSYHQCQHHWLLPIWPGTILQQFSFNVLFVAVPLLVFTFDWTTLLSPKLWWNQNASYLQSIQMCTMKMMNEQILSSTSTPLETLWPLLLHLGLLQEYAHKHCINALQWQTLKDDEQAPPPTANVMNKKKSFLKCMETLAQRICSPTMY